MSIININHENFQQEVLDSDKPVIVDFWAGWCGPCKMIAPVLDEIARENPQIKVCKINVDEQAELAAVHRIMSIPTLVIYKNGKISAQATGVRPKQQILDMI